MPVATPIEIRQLGIALEAVRGTCEAAPTKFLSLTRESDIDFATKILPDPTLRGYNARFPGFPGSQEGKGPFKTPIRASDICYWLKMVFGPVTSSTEQASFVVTTSSNDRIDFNIDGGGSDLVATIPAGTYVAGQTQADAGSLCKAVYDAIVAAEATGVYTVSYNRATGFFTIARGSGTFQMLFLTGTNTARTIAPLLGYTVTDKTGSLSYTGTVAQTPPFKHIFTQGQVTQLPSYSFYVNRGISTKQYPLGSVSKLSISGKDDAALEMDAAVMAQQEQAYGGAWSPVYRESPVLMFSGTTVSVAGSPSAVPNVADWSCELDPGLKAYRPLSQQQYPQDFLAAGPFAASGEATVFFMTEAERAKFLANTLTSLDFLTTGGIVAGGTVRYALDLAFPYVEYTAYPYGEQDGFLAAKVKFNAPGNLAAGVFVPLATAYVINAVPPGF